MAAELWPWQATPVWSDCGGDCRQEANWEEERLAAAVRLRIAVALELVAGKLRALLDTVQTARGYHRRNGTSSPCMGQELRPCAPVPRPTTLAEREGAASALRRLGNPSSRGRLGPPFRRTERQARGLDTVAQDNLADSLMPQDSTCRPYPHSTGPGLTRLGAGLYGPVAGE